MQPTLAAIGCIAVELRQRPAKQIKALALRLSLLNQPLMAQMQRSKLAHHQTTGKRLGHAQGRCPAVAAEESSADNSRCQRYRPYQALHQNRP